MKLTLVGPGGVVIPFCHDLPMAIVSTLDRIQDKRYRGMAYLMHHDK